MIKHIEDRVSRLSALVKGWKQLANVPRIERDLALDELRKIYDALLTIESGNAPTKSVDEVKPRERAVERREAEEPKAKPAKTLPKEHVEERVADPMADFDDALDIDALLGITDEDAEPQVLSTQEPIAPSEPEAEVTPTAGGGLFAIEDIPVRGKTGRKMINLYNSQQGVSEPKVQEPASAAAQPSMPTAPQATHAVADVPAPQRLGDVLGSGVKVVGDVDPQEGVHIAPMNKIDDIRKAIGLNDKFLLLRDLFAGDVALYERTIDRLNSFEDLDECMIYIVENFRWNPDSEGARMLVSLIERKLA